MRLAALEAHRIWAPTYDEQPNPLLALETRVLLPYIRTFFASTRFRAATVRQRFFLDIACGTGRWMLEAHKLGAVVLGVDACSEMLVRARQKPALSNRVVPADAASLPLASAIGDVTLCAFAASYFSDLGRAIAEMARITRAGGRVIISDMHAAAESASWSRGFHSCEIEHQRRTVTELCASARHAGLQFKRQLEAPFGEPERAIFRQAGKEHIFAKVSAIPAVWIGIWTKP